MKASWLSETRKYETWKNQDGNKVGGGTRDIENASPDPASGLAFDFNAPIANPALVPGGALSTATDGASSIALSLASDASSIQSSSHPKPHGSALLWILTLIMGLDSNTGSNFIADFNMNSFNMDSNFNVGSDFTMDLNMDMDFLFNPDFEINFDAGCTGLASGLDGQSLNAESSLRPIPVMLKQTPDQEFGIEYANATYPFVGGQDQEWGGTSGVGISEANMVGLEGADGFEGEGSIGNMGEWVGRGGGGEVFDGNVDFDRAEWFNM
ncbi:hypothetical protein BKA65DRAFT_485086 [Rhexocercosporidium sp. MPI-PUGE-AT-0058]|nr:hypothetical protein BKA65DRAFT_485086 [Rhexocercosporidium sp. MPI-PUGE-AT-0058]